MLNIRNTKHVPGRASGVPMVDLKPASAAASAPRGGHHSRGGGLSKPIRPIVDRQNDIGGSRNDNENEARENKRETHGSERKGRQEVLIGAHFWSVNGAGNELKCHKARSGIKGLCSSLSECMVT